jgi:hypothetical protein
MSRSSHHSHDSTSSPKGHSMLSNIFSQFKSSRGMILALAGAVLCVISGWQLSSSPPDEPLSVRQVSLEGSESGPFYETRSIETLEPGDEVLAFDPETGGQEWKTVEHSLRRVTDHLQLVTIENESDGATQLIRTTDEHPFWVVEQGWVEAGNLAPGDGLRLPDGKIAKVVDNRREAHPEVITVFNLTVRGFHTYYVSQDAESIPVLVHNNNRCEDLAKGAARAMGALDNAGDVAKGGGKSVTGIVNGMATPVPEGTVFRALREGEDPTKGLRARAPGANTDVGSHVMGKQQSDLISTTKDRAKAEGKFNSGNGVVEIDLSKVNGEVIDASQGVGKGRVYSRTKGHQEVLIRDVGGEAPPIPPEAIKRIQ